MSDNKYMNKVSKKTVNSHDNNQKKYPFQLRIIAPPNLHHQIQTRVTQVWNFDEIGFDPYGEWHKVVCAYKFFQEEIMCKVQTGECAPL